MSPTSTTTYTVTADQRAGSVTATATVTVAAPLPTVTLSASPASITSGDASTLTWSSTNATTVSITPDIGTVAASGTRSVSPTSTTTYTATATNDTGSVTATATLDVLSRLARLTLATNPAGLQLRLDGQPVATPLSFDSVVGSAHYIEATVQADGGSTYEFVSWSDGGAAGHDVSTPAQATTYTATFREVATPAQPSIRVNFQLASAPVPAGYLKDGGLAYGDRGNGLSYGWNADNTAQMRDRNSAASPDQRYDTLAYMQRPANPDAVWEIAVPNGSYVVRAVAGDPTYFDITYQLAVEGVLTVSGTSNSASRWVEGTATVTVSDGRITIRSAPGATANKICFVEITPQAPTPPTNMRVNFQLASAPVPAGYLADGGLAYGDHGNGQSYGWNIDNTAQMRDRNSAASPDQRYDTLAYMQRPANPDAVWEIAVPNGSYVVRAVAGDPTYFDITYRIAVEGVLTVSGTSNSASRWVEGTATVTVLDGRITIRSAPGATANKICFVEITPQ